MAVTFQDNVYHQIISLLKKAESIELALVKNISKNLGIELTRYGKSNSEIAKALFLLKNNGVIVNKKNRWVNKPK